MVKVEPYLQIHVKEVSPTTIAFTKKTRLWCQLPYPAHRKGCPNSHNKEECPPKMGYMDNILDDYDYFYLVYSVFDFKGYKDEMRELHKDDSRENYWTERMLGNSLFWQSQIKKKIRILLEKIYKSNVLNTFYLAFLGSGIPNKSILKVHQDVIGSMEAIGIHVFKTFKNNGIDFEVKPMTKVISCTLLCSKLKIKYKKEWYK
jgi:predicted metal-binding protein